jgi:hypothetical protein
MAKHGFSEVLGILAAERERERERERVYNFIFHDAQVTTQHTCTSKITQQKMQEM